MSSDINNSTVLFQDKTRQTAGQVFQGYYNNSLNLKKRIEALESGTNEGENLLGFTEVNDTVVWLDMRLGAPFGTLASNATAPQYKASKPIAITAGTYRLMGAGIGIYTSASNPIARISLASAYTANQITPIADSLEIERLTEIGSSIHEFKVTVKHDGYFVVDTFTNVAGTTFSGEIILQKIIGGGGDNGGGNAIDEHALLLAKYTDVDAFHYGDILSKMPKFKKAWKEKNQDIIIVGTGTSLMSRSTEHCTLRPDAKTRPPLLHSNNLASLIWDSLKWEGQEYRRYDSGFFVETGSGWQTSATHGDWDDSTAHDGLTRYSDQSGSTFSFTIPANAKSCNLIGRLDLNGTENAVIAVSEGNGVLQVWDENAGGTPAINLLENVTIADVIVDQRLGGMNANLTTNSSTPTYVASKPFFVKAGNYFVTGLGIGVYQPGSTPNMRASLWASISGGLPQGSPIANATSMVALTAAGSSPHQFILTVNQDGYIIIDMASNVAQTQLTGTATMIEQSEQSGEGAWVEANNYQFSMKNKPIKKVNFSHVNPINGVTDIYTDFPVTGNTTYQKRVVKLRAVDPSTTKTCTISRT
ncbi:MAG: hypothetical protein FWD31_12105, partial [Planctomycetaceae bacterium]|nr:hypothetical protein [Planctomycetaceae bacterium]